MRRFRSDGDNLRDMRISYTLLLSLAVLCTVMGTVLTRLDIKNTAKGLSDSYAVLTDCADTLISWENATDDRERTRAALRFENALASLPHGVELEPMIALAREMADGGADKVRVHALADTFLLLSSVDFENGDEARRNITATLNGVNGVVDTSPQEASDVPPQEVLLYTGKVVKRSLHGIFGGREGSMEPKLSADSGEWTVLADNVRMSFDSETGSLDAFVFLRLGAVPDETLSADARLSAAKEFYCTNRRRGEEVEATVNGELCGFTAVDIADGDERFRVCVDSHGRIWSLVKVKR